MSNVRRGLPAGLCIAVTVAVGGAAASAAGRPAPTVRHAPGWVVVRPTETEQPGLYRSMVVAVTAPDIAAARPFAPFTGFVRLSKRGIIVWATTIGRDRPTFTPLHWPLRLSSFRIDRAWEGQPAGNVQQRLEWGVVDGWDLDVRVYFGTQHPGKQLLREAQTELDRLVLPAR